ncbi:MAG: DUF4330 domain-containing protein [Nostocales cyanobacterium 94392]|nr:DUF4330 domain-containing protein [Nostocales cyanobacterium 94392]
MLRKIFNLSLTPVIVIAIAILILFSHISVSNAQGKAPTKPIEVDLLVNGLNILRPQVFLEQSLKKGAKTNLTIDNKPSGEMIIKSVQQLPITTNVTQPDGSVKELPDPSAKYKADILITLTANAQIQNTGTLIGESLVKIGSPAKIEGFNYDINSTVVDLRIQD